MASSTGAQRIAPERRARWTSARITSASARILFPLTQPALQYGYLALLAISLLIVAVMLAQEMTGDSGESEEMSRSKEPLKEGAKAETEDHEEPGWLMSVVGAVVLYSPVLTACSLA